jgi:hypothetical protein
VQDEHPVALVVHDDLDRSRLTVFFRLFLAIPHYFWFAIWTIAVFFVAIAGWVVTLITGRLPGGMHSFFCAYIRYTTHLFSYLYLVTDPYPPFNGRPIDGYPVDVALPDPAPQRRLIVLFRVLAAIPALVVSSAFGGAVGVPYAFSRARGNNRTTASGSFLGTMGVIAAFLGWFACMVRGQMPRGLRDTGAYGLGYRAQVFAYLLLVTERYPNSDPHRILGSVEPPPLHPVRLEGDALDLRRSRLTVFFRLPLLVPHLVWLVLWGWIVGIVLFLQWFVLLVAGRPAHIFHRFLSAYVRYEFHVYAFATLAANPFPGFTGKPGVYPLDLVLPGPGRQSRWKTFFRLFLAIPAGILAFGFWLVLFALAVLMWFTALFTAKVPEGLRNVAAWALRYLGQLRAYTDLITDVYPHSSPLEGAEPVREPEQEPLPGLEPVPA